MTSGSHHTNGSDGTKDTRSSRRGIVNMKKLKKDRSKGILQKCMQKVTFLGLLMKGVTNFKNGIINLDKLLGNMPMISTFLLGGSFLGSLEPCEAILKRPMTKLENLYLYRVGFDNLVHIQTVLCLIRSSPNLQKLDIRLDSELNSSDDTDLLDWMVLSGDMKLEQLEIIEIHGMVGSRTEFQFIKLLLASAPLLELIKVDKNLIVDDPNEELRILRELVQFPRASPTAQIKAPFGIVVADSNNSLFLKNSC